LEEIKYVELQNDSGIHLCPSEMEGFGHYIAEPMSAGCVVATTDGAPMNELVSPDRGFLVKTASRAPYMLGSRYSIDESSFEETIDEILETGEEELRSLAMKARSWYEQNDVDFRRRFLGAIDDLLA
jgi:glycosyltransferase involved in cell wall biosynthesis